MPKLRDIVGHEAKLAELEQDIAADNVAHAYLFSGPRHVGKMAIAHWFAEKLLCIGCDEGSRKSCRKHIEKLTHSDFFVLDQLFIEGKCEDWDTIAKYSNVPQQHRGKAPKAKTDVISIDDIRALQQRLHDTGTGKYRCCIIRSVERMQDAAANAFLKILEEPPTGLVFILTTQKESVLLPTIISRARTQKFQRLPQKDILSILDGVSEDDKQFITSLARGAPGIAFTLKDDPDALRIHKTVHSKAQSFWDSRSLKDRLALLEPLHKRGEESDQLLLHLGLALRGSGADHKQTQALSELARHLQTNAHRQLLSQRFALEVTA